jgi:hypothetical protein
MGGLFGSPSVPPPVAAAPVETGPTAAELEAQRKAELEEAERNRLKKGRSSTILTSEIALGSPDTDKKTLLGE